MYGCVPFMSIYTRIMRSASGNPSLASIALSNRLPRTQHKSSSEMRSLIGIWASTRTSMPCACASGILLLRIASAIALPDLIGVSNVLSSVSRPSDSRGARRGRRWRPTPSSSEGDYGSHAATCASDGTCSRPRGNACRPARADMPRWPCRPCLAHRTTSCLSFAFCPVQPGTAFRHPAGREPAMRSLVWSMIARFNGSYAPRGSGSVVPSVNCTDDLPTQRIRRRFTIIARPTRQNPSPSSASNSPSGRFTV